MPKIQGPKMKTSALVNPAHKKKCIICGTEKPAIRPTPTPEPR